MTPLEIALVAAGVVVGLAGGVLVGRARERSRQRAARETAEEEAARVREAARQEAENIRKSAALEGKEEAYRDREEWEEEEAKRREELERAERRLQEREETIDRRMDALSGREETLDERAGNLQERGEVLDARSREVDDLRERVRSRLEETAGLSAEEAKEELVEEIVDEAKADAANEVRRIREEAEREAEREARKIITLAIQRLAADTTAETTVSVVNLPSDDMKGRIIGREGRNIRAFEQATGVDVIVDDTPEAVVVSGFDPVRREVARIAMEKLVADGRIHPGTIEEMVEKAREEVDDGMVEKAEEILYDLGIHDVPAEIVRVLGRLKFRTSYGQNQLLHSKEVALLAGNMAAEMELDVQAAKRAGLLHDVGKGLTHEHEGTHVELGYELCEKHGESEIVLNAVRAHHDEEPHRFPETFLVSAADAISGSRPGARREMFDVYVKRLEKLERIAAEYDGVDRCFAIQAGRELRVMVEPDAVSDSEISKLSEEVARRIEDELQYPGQIKIVVIRENRAIDFAR